MSDIPIIGDGINPVNKRPQPAQAYSIPIHKTSKNVNLRLGEIMQGTVIDLPVPEEAVVRLPIGTLRAQLQGKLLRGDSLFFKVTDIEPSLVLKIHGVSVKNGAEFLSAEEIIRILNLPDFPVYKEIVGFLKKFRTTITRDECLLFNKILSSMEAVTKQIPTKELIQMLFVIHEAGIPLDTGISEKLLPLFRSGDSLAVALLQLEKIAKSLPMDINSNISRLMNLLRNPETNIYNRLRFFSLRAGENKSLFETLMDILKLESNENNDYIIKAKIASRYLLESIAALHLWNSLASQNNANLRLLYPMIIKGKPAIIHLTVQKQKENEPLANQNLQFFFETYTSELGEVVAQGRAKGKQINLSLYSQSKEAATSLESHSSMLRKALAANGFHLVSFSVSETGDSDIYLQQEQSQAQPKNFTIVV